MKKKTFRIPVIMLLMLALLFATSCSRKVVRVVEDTNVKTDKTDTNKPERNKKSVSDPIVEAEKNTSEAGKAVLEVGRLMVFKEKTIVKGSCWDYIYEVYKRAGYGSNKKIVYKSVKKGPYVDVSKIQPGDWLYYVNHSYGSVEHSGIFVYWKDYKNKIGVTLSYGGESRNEPGRYREYNLKSVYNIIRPGAK